MVLLRALGSRTLLRWFSQGNRTAAGEIRSRREKNRVVVPVQAHRKSATLRRLPQELADAGVTRNSEIAGPPFTTFVRIRGFGMLHRGEEVCNPFLFLPQPRRARRSRILLTRISQIVLMINDYDIASARGYQRRSIIQRPFPGTLFTFVGTPGAFA